MNTLARAWSNNTDLLIIVLVMIFLPKGLLGWRVRRTG